MSKQIRVMLVEARFYEDISDMLAEGAMAALEKAGASVDRFVVPGALELPGAIKLAQDSGRYDAYVALGCVIRGETSHYDTVANESARGVMDLTLQGLCIGNGVLTCENREQAIVRADPKQKNKGAGAVRSALDLLNLKRDLS